MTGDLANEERVLEGLAPATVLKVAHHGSKSSTSDAFLALVQPKEAVLSVGSNSYGHPSPDVLERLRARSVLIRRTDESGDVRYVCSKRTQECLYEP